jgi:hypothetical protein
LRIGYPREFEKVRLGDQPLLRARKGAGWSASGEKRNDQKRRDAQAATGVIHYNAPVENQPRRNEEHEGRAEEIFVLFVSSWLIFIVNQLSFRSRLRRVARSQ